MRGVDLKGVMPASRDKKEAKDMRYQGSLVQWNDERGFGWIAADGGGEKIFVHISAFAPRPPADQRPKDGQRLEFSVVMESGKKRAQQVSWRAAQRVQAQTPRKAATQATGRGSSRSGVQEGWHASRRFSYGALLIWLVLMLGSAMVWGVPHWLWLAYLVLSALTFMIYWQDKWAAQKGQWRTPEKTLQMLALAGGWPGAVLAQQWLRHKSSKTRFQMQFWCMVMLNVAGVLWLLSPYGRHLPN